MRIFALSSLVLSCACSSESPSPGPSTPRSENHRPPVTVEKPLKCSRSLAPSSTFGFARHASGDIVAFDTITGHQLKRHSLGSEVVDLDWDERTSRLLATSAELFDVEGSRVHALSFDGSELIHEASSEVFPGEVRVLSSPARVLVVGSELGSDWYELDDDLAVVGQSGALPRPLLVAEPDEASVLAFRREPQTDIVYRVSGFAAGWSSVELALPPRGLVVATAGQRSWFLQRGDSPSSFEVASLPTTSLSPDTLPTFRTVPGSCGMGTLHSLGVDVSGCVLVTVTGRAIDQLAVVPTFPGGSARCISLGAPLSRSSVWVPRNLALDRGGQKAWVATEQGVESFSLGPLLGKLPSFAGSELRAPLTLAR